MGQNSNAFERLHSTIWKTLSNMCFIHLPPPRDPGWGTSAWRRRRWTWAPGSAPGSSTAAATAAACGTPRRSPGCRGRWCGSSCRARGSRGTAATSGTPRRTRRSPARRTAESCSGMHRSTSQHFQITWNIWLSNSIVPSLLWGLTQKIIIQEKKWLD